MTSDEDMLRFHNGDTLESIPVVRLEPDPPRIPWRTVAGVVGTMAFVGSLVGLSVGLGERNKTAVSADPMPSVTSAESATPQVTVPPPVVPTVTATVTQTAPAPPPAEQDSYIQQAPYIDASAETVMVSVTPSTGGDPSMDYCLTYEAEGAVLLANAPVYACQDFLFSTHPKDGAGVFEVEPPTECGDTTGGRLAQLFFEPSTAWGEGSSYTCLLANDGA